jgi:hypothetical protein
MLTQHACLRCRTPALVLDDRRRVRMALDIARGMNYLHSCRPPIVHRCDAISASDACMHACMHAYCCWAKQLLYIPLLPILHRCDAVTTSWCHNRHACIRARRCVAEHLLCYPLSQWVLCCAQAVLPACPAARLLLRGNSLCCCRDLKSPNLLVDKDYTCKVRSASRQTCGFCCLGLQLCPRRESL